MNNDFVSFISLQPDVCYIFVYSNNTNNSNKFNINCLDIKKYKRCNNLNIECPICYNKIKSSEYIRELHCNHIFHKKCIDKWLLLSMKSKETINCPICRKIINLI